MKKVLRSNKFRVILALLIIAAVAGISFYRTSSTRLLDKQAYSEFRTALEEAGAPDKGGFESQSDLSAFIKQWADDHSLEYTEDKYGNLIFDREAVSRKKNVTPTLVAVSMNYETAFDNSQVLASAASIALSDIDSGRRTVVFFNDEQALARGYKGISKKLIGSKSKVIYLDKGASLYMSTGSFEQRISQISVPASREDNTFDTAVRISISGISSGMIGPAIGIQPDPISAMSTLLTRLKSKSVEYRLADVSTGSNGNMYPVSMEVTIVLNSYNLSSFTGYIDKRIKAWEKAYSDDFPDLVYTYEVIDEEDALPETVYSADTTDKLTGVLYTVKSGTYRYTKGDSIPEGKEEGDIYGINCLTALDAGKNDIKVSVITQGVDDSFTERIMNDNKAGSELYGCKLRETESVPAFVNDRNSLSRTFMKTYKKVNDDSSAESLLQTETDSFFTPCPYLAQKNSKADIIHIRTKGSKAAAIANTILCYMKTKGNTSIF